MNGQAIEWQSVLVINHESKNKFRSTVNCNPSDVHKATNIIGYVQTAWECVVYKFMETASLLRINLIVDTIA